METMHFLLRVRAGHADHVRHGSSTVYKRGGDHVLLVGWLEQDRQVLFAAKKVGD
jgi:hypothetical protein